MIPIRTDFETSGRCPSTLSIVHDLRNPLTSIHAGAELLLDGRLSPVQLRRIARNIHEASVRMRELLADFLEQTRSSKRRFETSDLRDLVTDAVAEVAISAELQSVHIVQVVPERVAVALDRNRMERVLVNLLVNSLQAMPRGGSIHVSAVADRRSVVIRIRDSGPGIHPEIRDRLFQPFATAGKADGIGLGLAFSRQAVLDDGGEMWAEPSSEGACFAVRLPLTLECRAATA
jgi:signal transduction histidine kinase